MEKIHVPMAVYTGITSTCSGNAETPECRALYIHLLPQIRINRSLMVVTACRFMLMVIIAANSVVWLSVVIRETMEELYYQNRKSSHDDVMKWKHFPRYWPCVRVIHRWIPLRKRPLTRSFDVFFDLRWWFETPSRSSWRHCNGMGISKDMWNSWCRNVKIWNCIT